MYEGARWQSLPTEHDSVTVKEWRPGMYSAFQKM